MGNRNKAKELREAQNRQSEANTKAAMAAEKNRAIQADDIAKVQEDLENLKLLLADTNEAKEELEQELEEIKKENASLEALVEEKQKQIENLKASNQSLQDEIGTLKEENKNLKAPAKSEPKKK
jgi:chromosome segregation ATPase